MTDEHDDPYRRDWWMDYTTEKIGAVLFGLELRQEDRNGQFTLTGIGGALLIGATIWRGHSDPTADPWALLWVVIGFALLVAGVALRINGGVEIRHLRRLQRLASNGRIPE